MPVQRFKAQNFRCLEEIELEADRHYNVIYGPNASGKTSLLEALAYLGRGKSFRGAATTSLIRHEQSEFVLFGQFTADGPNAAAGVRNGPDGLEMRIDGEPAAGAAALAEALPLQVIDPDVHNLVSGGPDVRRRYLDWLAFHVEHDYLSTWRQFRRALKQRNAALKAGGNGLDAWTAEFVELGGRVDSARRSVLDVCREALEEQGSALLGSAVRFEYRPGWSLDKTLEEAVSEGLERDLHGGVTHAGPHRADIRLVYDDRQARKLVSRGQQKLLACGMVLAATEIVQNHLAFPLLLLLDDPASELDPQSLGRLMTQVFRLGCQVVATALDPAALTFPEAPAMFHVEHGVLTPK